MLFRSFISNGNIDIRSEKIVFHFIIVEKIYIINISSILISGNHIVVTRFPNYFINTILMSTVLQTYINSVSSELSESPQQQFKNGTRSDFILR